MNPTLVWTCAWWMTVSACSLMDATAREIEGRHPPAQDLRDRAGLVCFVVWGIGLVVASL